MGIRFFDKSALSRNHIIMPAYSAGSGNVLTVASIQVSASRVIWRALLPAGVMAGPIEMVTVPGLFSRLCLRHRYPALCATGITPAPDLCASRPPPRQVIALCPRRDPSALRKDNDPQFLSQALGTLRHELAQ